MKKHGYCLLIGFIAILGTIVLYSSCRSSYQSDAISVSQRDSTFTGLITRESAATVLSNIKTVREKDSSWYKITRTYDTSKPVDPQTGLPPLASETLQGSQASDKGGQENAYIAHTQDSVQKQKGVHVSNNDSTSKQKSHQGEVLSGIDKGLSSGIMIGLSIGIPLFFVIIGIVIYRNVRTKKNPSN